jgi:hypothetical protein
LFFGKDYGEGGFPSFGKVGGRKAGVVKGEVERDEVWWSDFEESIGYVVFARGCEGIERVYD